jgi:lauroyl/myristoyl acyltransferase
MRPALKALRSNEQVLAAIVVPADSVDASVDIEMLGATVRVPRGLLRVAADNGIAVTLFMAGLNVSTGRRKLRLSTLPVDTNPDRLTQTVFDNLDQAIRHEPWAWHFWAQADRFFTPCKPSQNA